MSSYGPVSLVILSVMSCAVKSFQVNVRRCLEEDSSPRASLTVWSVQQRACDRSQSELCLSRPLSHCISVITYIIMKRLSAGGLGLSQSLLSLFSLSLGRWQKLGSKETDWAQWRARAAGTSIVGRERGLCNTILSLSLPVPRGCALCQPYQQFPS